MIARVLERLRAEPASAAFFRDELSTARHLGLVLRCAEGSWFARQYGLALIAALVDGLMGAAPAIDGSAPRRVQ